MGAPWGHSHLLKVKNCLVCSCTKCKRMKREWEWRYMSFSKKGKSWFWTRKEGKRGKGNKVKWLCKKNPKRKQNKKHKVSERDIGCTLSLSNYTYLPLTWICSLYLSCSHQGCMKRCKETMGGERKWQNMFLEKWDIVSSEVSCEATSVSNDRQLITAGWTVS